MDQAVNNILKTSLDNLKEMVDLGGIVGKPIGEVTNSMVIPISKIKISFASGGVELFKDQRNNPYGGGIGGGVTITPLGFLVVKDDDISLLHVESMTHVYEEIVKKGENVINNMINKNRGTQN